MHSVSLIGYLILIFLSELNWAEVEQNSNCFGIQKIIIIDIIHTKIEFPTVEEMNFLVDPFKYLFNTFHQQVVDHYVRVKQIIEFYNEEIHEQITTKAKIKEINTRINKVKNYHQWQAIAKEYDELPPIQQKINKVYSPYYDYDYIQELIKCLAYARQQEQLEKIIAMLRSHSYRNIGNINSHLLYRDALTTNQKLIEDFQIQISKCLDFVLRSNIETNRKLQFFGEMRHAIGRSALLLSGGAILGMYHIGVVQALIQADCMPKILAGSSAGSIIASFLATKPIEHFFDEGKWRFQAFANKKKVSLWRRLKSFGKQGYLMDIRVLKEFLRDNIGDVTFQQAFDKYGWILNITVTGTGQHDEDRLLNYLTAPNVLIWSASAASCAIPYVYGATDLYCKNHDGKLQKYILMNRQFLDGSIGHDLPMNKLSIFFNVNNFIVSQTNPWVIPFMDYTEEFKTINNPIVEQFLLFCHRIKQFSLSEVKHRAFQLSYIFPSAITKFLNIFTQSYVGNITIWPVPSLSDYLRIMENPTSFDTIQNFVKDGRSRTYPKVLQIRSSLFLQKQIQKRYKRTRKGSFFINKKELTDPNQEQEYHQRKMEQKFIEDQLQRAQHNFSSGSNTNLNVLNIAKEIKMARNSSFMIPRSNSRDSEDFKKRLNFKQSK